MKRDMDLIRHLLLEIEEKDDGEYSRIAIDNKEWTDPQVIEHLFQLHEAGLLEGTDASHLSGRAFLPRRLTTYGHDYLDTIRDPKIWAKAKEGAAAAGGLTLELFGDLAKGLIKTQIKKFTDVDL